MSRAVTRRGALRGSAVVAFALAGGAAPAFAQAAMLDPADARLIELAGAAEALERRCDAFTAARRGLPSSEHMKQDDAFGDLCDEFLPIKEEITATPAATMAGVLAKARALQIPTCRQAGAVEIGHSIADDLWRLFGGGAA